MGWFADRDDPHSKLRPPPPTSADEICSCAGWPPIALQDHLSENPLACLACNLEVPPERIGFPATLAEELADWRSFHAAFYTLWLDSCGFEAWAKAQLEAPDSPVNVRGLALVAKLNGFRRTYCWWFQDESQHDPPPSRCPTCAGPLVERCGRGACEACSIALARWSTGI